MTHELSEDLINEAVQSEIGSVAQEVILTGFVQLHCDVACELFDECVDSEVEAVASEVASESKRDKMCGAFGDVTVELLDEVIRKETAGIARQEVGIRFVY